LQQPATNRGSGISYQLSDDVSRYLSDPLHISQTGLDTANVIDVYQLTVTDGQSKRKVLLDPELARIVQSGQVVL
jgi:hypothetical protein